MVDTAVIKVYGPYVREDGRKHVILYDGTRRTECHFAVDIVQVKEMRECWNR